MPNVNIEPSWHHLLKEEFEKPYFIEMADFLRHEKKAGKTIFPPGSLIFNAFNTTPFHEVKVVILGQDPYHNPGEAMGLSFSVPEGTRLPPSLKNIFKEISQDLNLNVQESGDLSRWARQGVFLLNAMLTVEKNQAGSHKNIGWQQFTDTVIHKLSSHREKLVFLLWGNFAKSKKSLINPEKHLILEAAHPSPLAGGAFFGCRHFSETNKYLLNHGIMPIDWN